MSFKKKFDKCLKYNIKYYFIAILNCIFLGCSIMCDLKGLDLYIY